MAQLVLGFVGAAIGNAFLPTILGVSGAGLGWALGSYAGAQLSRPKYTKPPVGDLNAPELAYGAPLPRVWGTVATAGALAWMSDKRYVEQTAEVGKGGGQTVTTGYTYSADMMFVVAAESDVIALTRVWRNGKLVWSNRAGATADTYAASADTPLWDAIELRAGGPSQTAWSVYETAVGTADALAYRRRATVCITNAQFGSSPTPPSYLFEVITAGTSAPSPDLLLRILGDQADGTNGTSVLDTGAYSLTLNAVGAAAVESTSAWDGIGSLWSDGTSGSQVGMNSSSANAALGTGDFTIDVACRPDAQTNRFPVLYSYNGGGLDLFLYYDHEDQPDAFLVRIGNIAGLGLVDYEIVSPAYGTGTWRVVTVERAGNTVYLYVDGAIVASTAVAETLDLGSTGLHWLLGRTTASSENFYAGRAELRVTGRALYGGAGHTAPTSFAATEVVWTPGTEDLDDVVSELCTACVPLASSLIDVTGLNGVPVRGFAAVGSPRQALEQLAAAYYFSCTSSDKLYFRRRGGASAATIAYASLGAGVRQPADEPLGLERGNGDEVARKIALTYVNVNADHEPGTVTGDRGAGREGQVDARELALVLTPTEAQQIADAWAMDARVASTTFKPPVTDYYAALEPTDVVTLTDADGSTYRARIVAEDYAASVKRLECVLDDASVLTQPGTATDNTTPTISIAATSDTTARLLDIPILRDADNDPGFYVAAARTTSTQNWPGYTLAESIGGSAYATVYSSTAEATIGTATTTLGDYTGVGFDEKNVVRVSVNGTLASTTRDAILAGTGTAYLIGSEIVYARTATLVSAGVYDLSGLLRGLRGTEWAQAGHAGSERVVVLSATTMRRVLRDAAEIGLAYSYKAPTFGKSLTGAAAQTFTDTGIGLKPFAPTDLRVARDTSNNATVTLKRRTRLSHRFLSAGIDAPLGETAASYALVVYSSGAYSTALRTITSSTESFSYTAAQQTADGLTPGNTLYLRAYQLSSVVGYGYALQAAA